MLINILFRLVVEAFKWGIWDKILKYILSVVIVVFLNCNCCKEWKFLWVNVASLHLRCHVITVILNAVVCTSVIVIVDHKNLTSAENVVVVDSWLWQSNGGANYNLFPHKILRWLYNLQFVVVVVVATTIAITTSHPQLHGAVRRLLIGSGSRVTVFSNNSVLTWPSHFLHRQFI